MKIIVTGGAGFIGSNLVKRLIKSGHIVMVVDKFTYAGNMSSIIDLINNPSLHVVNIDICDADAIRRLFAGFYPQAIMHLAAESHVDRSISGPRDFIMTNINGTFQLLDCAREYWMSLSKDRRRKFRFLHVSTDEVFGSLNSDEPPFNEKTRYSPHSPYSASKASSDHLVRAWGDTYGLPVLVTNCSNNYGPYQYPEKLIPMVILKSIRGESIPIYGKGQNVRDWLYVEDHIDGLAAALKYGKPGSTYCFGGGCEFKNIDIVRLICSTLDQIYPRPDKRSYKSQISFVKDRPGHDLRYAINYSHASTELNWFPRTNFYSGILTTIRWYLANTDWISGVLDKTINSKNC